MTSNVLFVTGTGTGVGKTVVTAALATLATGRVAVLKPAQTGIEGAGDCARITRLAGEVTTVERARYPDPLAPATAARRVGQAGVSTGEITEEIRRLAGTHDLVLAEGAGGLLVPLHEDGSTLADAARAVSAPVLVVCPAGLGALNLAALTVRAVRQHDCHCPGLVIGSEPAEPDLAVRCNRADLPWVTGVPLLGSMPEGAGELSGGRFHEVARNALEPALAETLRAGAVRGHSARNRAIDGRFGDGAAMLHGVSGSSQPVILVIGAGVMGLTTGIVLAEAGHRVRIRTAERPNETTSATAGAIWAPPMLEPAERARGWAESTYFAFVQLARDPATGVRLTPGIVAARFDLGAEPPPETRLLADMRQCDPAELPSGFVSGYHSTNPMIDMPRYLDYLTQRYFAAGGELLLSSVSSLSDAAAEAGTVVNCTGVGARELVGDPGVVPALGQHVVVENPGVEEYFVELGGFDRWTSYMPHGDKVVLGGIAVEHDWDRQPDPDVTAGIMNRCAAVQPLFRDAPIRAELVGLRPRSNTVRLRIENFEGARIVHNYGHGGSGVTVSWGCAGEAARLATQ